MVKGLILTLVLALVLLSSCEGGGPSTGPGITTRSARLRLFTVVDSQLQSFLAEGRAPREIAFLISYSGGPQDTGTPPALIRKFEINYGDGTGWVDVTADRAFWDYDSESDPAGMTHYVYDAPGTYLVQARAEFHDGEVVYDRLMATTHPDGYPLTVLPVEQIP